ncbi:glycosyl transferase [Colletotrichum musicola]|uniref:Glycosyl transferase n=2 Tax=Colletotrichum orchidearum species complex TaxID=2707337 RepID=A0A8H6IS58_9PEZI|nr:glycosyl transferase [Colletotrichum musicola]KAF6829595.1 glycosyl transferase [Colletotrichum plurivorum]
MSAETSSASPSDGQAVTGARLLPIPLRLLPFVNDSLWGRASFSPNASPEALTALMAYRAASYERDGFFGRALFTEARDDFETWTYEDMTKVRSEVVKYLRQYLYDFGVHSTWGRGSLDQKLFAMLNDETFHSWTDEEIADGVDRSRRFQKNIEDIPWFFDDITMTKDKARAFVVDLKRRGPSRTPSGPPSPTKPPIHLSSTRQTPPPKPSRESIPIHQHPREQASDTDDKPTTRQLQDLSKAYKDEERYSGERYDVLETKLLIFRHHCLQLGIPQSQFAEGFSKMLKGKAAEFYYENLYNPITPLTFHDMVRQLKDHFETDEVRRSYLEEWRAMTLHDVIRNNPDKSKVECLEQLLQKLVAIQRALPILAQTDYSLREQAISACQGIPECALALYHPAPTFEGLRHQLFTAIGTASRMTTSSVTSTSTYNSNPIPSLSPANQNITDRTYKGNGRSNRFGKYSQPYRATSKTPQSTRRCYICKKQGCWTTNHSMEERRRSYERFKANQYVQDSSTEAFEAFLVKYEGIESIRSDDDEDLSQFLTTNDDEGYSEDSDQFHVSVLSNDTTSHGMAARLLRHRPWVY